MRIAIACGVYFLIVGSWVGCGGGGPDINATQDNICDQVASVACWDMYKCCSEGEIEQLLRVSDPRTVDQCHADVHTLCERQVAQLDFSVKNKHLKFDGKIMNDCLNALVAPDGECVTLAPKLPWTELCMESAWSGIVADGAACDFANECSKDSFCSNSRVCTALPGDGMPCAAQGCATGLYCGTGTCHPLLAQGGMCTATTQCQKGMFCDTTGTHTCTPLHANGDACTGNATCESNTCLPGACAGTGGTCFTASSCFAHCADNNAFCTVDSGCGTGMGTCSIGGATCSVALPCGVGAGTCVYPVKCLPAACNGNIVCAEAHAVVNYCQGAIDALPLF
jgi:hypothetical protein